MTRAEELKTIMEFVINNHYSQDEFDLFKAEYGWEDWMNDYTDAEEDKELSETEIREIDAILEEGFKMAFDDTSRQVYGL
jgi:hypothetical protein